MRYEKVLETVKLVNKQLLHYGYSWKQIDEYWIECHNEVKTRIDAENQKAKMQGM